MLATSSQFLIAGQELITEFLNAIKDDMINYMDTENRNATGRSRASIQVVNVTDSGGQVVGNEGIEFVFRGRGPGKMPPLFNIIEWCYARGIPRAAAWIIAKRISEAGTKLYRSGRDVLQEIITEERINKFIESLTVLYTVEIESDIKTLFESK